MKKRRAFMSADMIFGIIIVGMVTGVLLGSVSRERAAESALADRRSAIHLAEHALLNLQHHQPLPVVNGGMQLKVQPAKAGVSPDGFAWVRIDAAVNGRHHSLVGIVPMQSNTGGKS